MRSSRLAVLLACSLPIGAAYAQADVRVGRVRGMVVDSLLGATLPGATVRVAALGRVAVTDSTGRFVIDSVPPGEWDVSFRHPGLDSLGFAEIGATVRVFAGATAAVTLATPSFDAYRTKFCADTPDSLTSTVVFGGVHATDGSRVRVDVRVTWIAPSTTDPDRRGGSVRTNSEDDQEYWLACGIPWGAWIYASLRDSMRVATALLKVGSRGLAARDLVLSSDTVRISGTVRDVDGHAVAGAHLSVVDTDVSTTSDTSGRFAMNNAPRSTFTLDVRAAGHHPWIGVLEGSPDPINVHLQSAVASTSPETRGSDYLRLLKRINRPGISLLAGSDIIDDSTAVLARIPLETCRWWFDGRPVSREFFLAQPPSSWRALELYARGSDAPPEYRSPSCPVVLLWTGTADW